jgi:catalase
MKKAEKKILTTNLGNPVADDQSSVTTGKPTFTLMTDTHLVEKISPF